MENLDLVITIDTSMAHLTGALGGRPGLLSNICPTGGGCWMEKAKAEKEAHVEFEREHLGYCGKRERAEWRQDPRTAWVRSNQQWKF